MIEIETTADANAQQILQVLRDYIVDPDSIPSLLEKMATEYILVHELDQLVEGRYVRWIREGVMTRGGIVMQIGQDDLVLCKTANHQLMRFHFDQCPCFAKLNQFEQWYLLNQENDTNENDTNENDTR